MVSGIRKKKQFGQHFLTNPETARRITEFLAHAGHVVEIGPGAGALTTHLVRTVSRLTLVETDGELIPDLEARFGCAATVVQADALHLFKDPPPDWDTFAVISNLPYNISAPLTLAFCQHTRRIPELVLMYQKEVADKLTREAGPLRLAVWPFYETRQLMTLKPGSFSPPPKVDSAVVRMTRREPLILEPQPDWFRFCRRVFENRRKMLYNNLMKTNREIVTSIFNKLSIDRKARAESLDHHQLLALYKEMKTHGLYL